MLPVVIHDSAALLFIDGLDTYENRVYFLRQLCVELFVQREKSLGFLEYDGEYVHGYGIKRGSFFSY
jgi:hypothetical protein